MKSYFDESLELDDLCNYINSQLSKSALYEGLAEECSELAHAALKLARAERDENPVDKIDFIDLRKNLFEEMNDVYNYMHIIGGLNQTKQLEKMRRFKSRVVNMNSRLNSDQVWMGNDTDGDVALHRDPATGDLPNMKTPFMVLYDDFDKCWADFERLQNRIE